MYIPYEAGEEKENVDRSIAPDMRGYEEKNLISLQKHMLWVLIRSALVRHF